MEKTIIHIRIYTNADNLFILLLTCSIVFILIMFYEERERFKSRCAVVAPAVSEWFTAAFSVVMLLAASFLWMSAVIPL